LEFKLHIQRKPLFYLVNLICPTSIITLIAIVGFFSSSTVNDIREEKISLGITTASARMSLLLVLFYSRFPNSAAFHVHSDFHGFGPNALHLLLHSPHWLVLHLNDGPHFRRHFGRLICHLCPKEGHHWPTAFAEHNAMGTPVGSPDSDGNATVDEAGICIEGKG
jgi:hypothetical protein